MNDEDSEEIKTILVGMSGAGKTNIINAMIDQPFDSNKISTLVILFEYIFNSVQNFLKKIKNSSIFLGKKIFF